MNFQLANLQDLELIVTSLLSEAKCACHIINPHKTRILMWKESQANQTTYHLRIGIQKFTSQEQVDRNGEIYWRYWSEAPKEVKEEVNQTESDSITKFRTRQAKTEALNHGKSESATNCSEQSESTSH